MFILENILSIVSLKRSLFKYFPSIECLLKNDFKSPLVTALINKLLSYSLYSFFLELLVWKEEHFD